MASGKRPGNDEKVRRFNKYRIIEHLILIALFVTLVMTGLPQKFYALRPSRSLIIFLGGIDSVRMIHHVAGVLFTVFFVQHVVVNFLGIAFFRWAPSMLIALKDVQDAVQNSRYYLGLVGQPAQCGRYTYKEKCIYWLILMGGLQMVLSGFVLWFPVTVTKFMPGQIIPVAKIIHTSEAMLIFLLVATWHIYDSIFSPDVFPLNKSIFTGYIGKRQMEKRHPMELLDGQEEGQEAGSSLLC